METIELKTAILHSLDMNLGMAKYLAARYLKVLEQIDTEPIKWHLLREKAKTWIADHAVEKAAG